MRKLLKVILISIAIVSFYAQAVYAVSSLTLSTSSASFTSGVYSDTNADVCNDRYVVNGFQFQITGVGNGSNGYPYIGYDEYNALNVSSGDLGDYVTITRSDNQPFELSTIDIINYDSVKARTVYLTATYPNGSSSGEQSVLIQSGSKQTVGCNFGVVSSIVIKTSDQGLVYSFDNIGLSYGYAQININGNGTQIINGDISPSVSENTDFGTANVSGGSVAKTYTIENTSPSGFDDL
jgi:hypothetical protein